MKLTGTLDHTGTLLRDAADLAADVGAKRAAIIVDLAGGAAAKASEAAHAIPEAASDVGSRASDLSVRDMVIAGIGATLLVVVVVAVIRRLRSRDEQAEPALETA